MIRIMTVFVLMVMLIFSSESAQAQGFTPPEVNVPWNQYIPSRIPDGYNTIIGLTGTSSGLLNTTGSILVPLPFPFYFLGQTYNTGYNLNVACAGYLSFNGSTTNTYTYPPILYYNTTTSYNYYTHVVAPYWSDLYTANVSQGGIYWRTDGSTPNRVMTIEWRVQGINYPGGTPGNFQCKLYEGTGNIEFHYGPTSLDRTVPTTNPQTLGYGAWVGIKKYGQNQTGAPTGGDDSEKFLWMLHPDQNINSYLITGGEQPGRDTIAITRARTGPYGGSTQYFEYYAYLSGYIFGWYGNTTYLYYVACPFYHYSFPTQYGARIAYRMSPVINDVATDSVWFTPTRVANAYGIGSTVTVNARFKNIGANARQNVAVKYDVYRNGTQYVASGTGTAFPSAGIQFSTSSMTFSATVGQPITNVTGQYQVRVYPQLTSPMDQDNKNDTLYANFYISRSNDLMTYALLQPFSNQAPLFNKYPVGVGVPLEVRYLNIGTSPQTNARVGYIIYDANGNVVATNTAVITGSWSAIQFRDINFSPWTPTTPGRYYFKAFTLLNGDEDATNDTLTRWPDRGKPFDVLYEIEISAGNPQLYRHSPQINGFFPDGKPVPVEATFFNSGVSDATNIPATVQITYNGNIVYNRTATISNITSDGGSIVQSFPDFIPNGAGQYCVTAFSNYSQEPVRSNDTIRWCFNVKPRLAGIIRVGFGERFRTIQEARDSLFRYGVGGPLTFELVDDSYTVAQAEPTIPALDFRGRVVGLNASNPVLWRPVAGKTSITINLKTGSGIGMWYGQRDTSNPSGYITWDGGANKVLHFTYQNTGTKNTALPVFFGTGSSNYVLKNLSIEPITGSEMKTATTLSMPSYNSTFNQFSFTPDLGIQTSAGVMFRNTPAELLPGATIRPDSLRNQNNVIDNVTIRNFAYGIASVGAGPLWEVANNRYGEYLNTNNTFSNNVIEDVSRGGIIVAFEKNSKIIGNTIRRVENTSTTVPSAAGIAATAGGNVNGNNRGYSSDLDIEKNKVSTVIAKVGSAAAISVETNENVFVSPTTQIFRFPTNGATNMQVVNNMAWDYSGAQATAGVALMVESTTRRDFMTTGNRVENNTLFNKIAGATVENGIYLQRSASSVKNNIIALDSRDAANGHTMVALAIEIGNYQQTIQSDYNLFWVPQGSVGMITNLSSEGYVLPSKPVATTLQQWQALTGLDMNSVYGDVTGEFVSTTPGAVDLHINANLLGSLASDRGTAVSGVTSDIDGDPRNQTTRPDIGADEYAGKVRNYDLTATNVVAPFGYRATSGQYADAEYLMVPAGPIGVSGEVRNIGGQPFLQNVVTLTIERKVGSGWAMMASNQVTTAVDAGAAKTLSFGTFTPQTLGQLGQSDAFYGTNPNVTPVYRFTVTTGTDDNAANNGYSKEIRFYVQRSNRQTMVAVKNFQTSLPSTPAGLSNKLNTDSVLSALNQIAWDRADGVGADDYDLFERDKWPSQNLNFVPWRTVIWSQGEEAQGLQPEERAALKAQMTSGDLYFRKNLIIAGQEVARIHDVALTSSNGAVADRDFVRNYLRAEYRGTTTPSNYDGRRIQGVRITPGKYEVVKATGVANDPAPMPSTLRLTTGEGIAAATHSYVEQTVTTTDTVAGVAATGSLYNSIYYAIDWRHAGRFSFEASQSGVRRMLLGALDYVDQFRGVLPVKLLSFDAYQSSRTAVTLEWKTASEVDVAAMEIERAELSRDAQGVVEGNYSVVNRQGSVGSATSGATYRTVDEGVTVGREYRYRLVTVSVDGTRSVEETKVVKVEGAAAGSYNLTVLPNPMRENGSVSYVVPSGERVRVVLYDGVGRQVKVLSEGVEGSGRVEIPVSELSSGSYTVRLEGASGVAMSEKVTVQK